MTGRSKTMPVSHVAQALDPGGAGAPPQSDLEGIPQPSGDSSAPSGDRGHVHGVTRRGEHRPAGAAIWGLWPPGPARWGRWHTHPARGAQAFGAGGTQAPQDGAGGTRAHAGRATPARKRQLTRKRGYGATTMPDGARRAAVRAGSRGAGGAGEAEGAGRGPGPAAGLDAHGRPQPGRSDRCSPYWLPKRDY